MTASYYGDNHTGERITKPVVSAPKGEINGKRRHYIDRIIVPAGLALNEEIDFGFLPPNCLVLSAEVFVNKSLGATGIIDLGLRATKDLDGNTVAEDADALVDGADAGGQAVRKKQTTEAAALKRYGLQETQVFAKCVEAVDGTIDDAVLTIVVEYSHD